jgi:hypothetical protein
MNKRKRIFKNCYKNGGLDLVRCRGVENIYLRSTSGVIPESHPVSYLMATAFAFRLGKDDRRVELIVLVSVPTTDVRKE